MTIEISCHTCKHCLEGMVTCALEEENGGHEGLADNCIYGKVVMEHSNWKRYNDFHYSLWEVRNDIIEFIALDEMEL